MRRYLIKIAAIASFILGGSIVPNAMATYREARARVVPNEIDDVMITKIVPSEPRIELTYKRLNPLYYQNAEGTPAWINIGYGNLSDKDIYDLKEKTVEQVFSYIPGVTKVLKIQFYEFGDVWEDRMTIAPQGYMINSRADLAVASEGRLVYAILFTNGERLIGRVDYSRCIYSSVFLDGTATECRMEELGNGKVQYQPYTSDGVRVEIPADEDRILTAAIESWVPEYGWPELVEPEPEPEPEPVEPEPVEPEPVESEPVESEPVEPESELIEAEPELNPAGSESVDSEEFSIELEERGATSTSSKMVLAGFMDEKTEVIKSNDDDIPEENIEMKRVDAISDVTEKGGKVDEDVGVEEKIGDSEEQIKNEVEVPNLGQETDKKPNIALTIVVIMAIGAALVAMWWLLFLGKNKSKERKERKE